jgi:hypothetical protein
MAIWAVAHGSSSFTLGEFSGTTWYQCVFKVYYDANNWRLSFILAPVGFWFPLHVTPLTFRVRL